MSEKTIHIEAGTLVVLSGLPASGKSTLRDTAQAPHGATAGFIDRAWLSADDLRVAHQGSYPDVDEFGLYTEVPNECNDHIWPLLRKMVELRVKNGFTAVIDAVNPTDADRRDWAQMAAEAGVPFKVLIMDTSLEDCLASNRTREKRVPEHSIRQFHQPATTTFVSPNGASLQNTPPQGFMLESEFPFETVKRGDKLVFDWPTLEHNRYDVIGDTHGLLDELIELLKKAGWTIEADKVSHPDGRKLLLLGDLVDRGTQSLELVRFVRRLVRQGVADVIKGNHEAKLVKFYRTFHSAGVSTWGSYANAQTGIEFVKAEDGEELINFLHNLPTFKAYVSTLTGQSLMFSHANLIRLIPGVTPQDELLYGQTGFERMDTDAMYQQRYDLGVNKWTLIRGHIPQTSPQENVLSLERHPFQCGELVLMRLDEFEANVGEGNTQSQAFEKSLVTLQCDFDFEAYSARYQLARDMNSLVSQKMATAQVDGKNTMRVFKYSKDTFFRNRWTESDMLAKARGLVLDAAGNIVSHPFDKCFNLHENGTGDDLDPSTPLVVPDKYNGFLGIVSKHPFESNQLLVHTQGSFGGEFVGYINDFLTPEVSGRLKKYLARNDVTLCFEVIHPDDPHIIEYEEQDHGLWLLGVRGKGMDDLSWTEENVDSAAQEMGLRRPAWRRMTLAQLLEACRDETGLVKVEGWMAREDTAEQRHLFKLKTPYYLVTKFVSRLSSRKVGHLFGNPTDFKKNLDEEFFPLVDALVAKTTKDEFLQMEEPSRVAFVGKLVHDLI